VADAGQGAFARRGLVLGYHKAPHLGHEVMIG
jgi:hypothetical protein